jgi:peptidoglycan/LPS O-acetylase OafA/YrhL
MARQLVDGARKQTTGGRMTWLDGLRGFAAIVVVFWHLGPRAVVNAQSAHEWVDLGKFGVVLFFIISGYVIPMSLERHGSLRHFWVSRIFRLYPAWAVSAVLMLVLLFWGLLATPAGIAKDPVTTAVAHLTMLQGLLGVSNLVWIYWTLSYEMVFYLIVAGLFAFRLHRHSALFACLIAGTAVLGGTRLPGALFTGDGEHRRAAVVGIAVALLAVVAGYVSGRRRLALGCAVISLGAVAIPLLNGGSETRGSWQSLMFIAAMFTGTIIHRIQHGRIRPLTGLAAIAFVLACGLGGAWLYIPDPVARRVWVSTLVLAAAAFAVTFLFLRRFRTPRFAEWLGQISYPVYLLHMVLLVVFLKVLPDLTARPVALQISALAGYLAALFVLAHVTHQYVELPAQNAGRRLSRRLERRRPDIPRSRQEPITATHAVQPTRSAGR